MTLTYTKTVYIAWQLTVSHLEHILEVNSAEGIDVTWLGPQDLPGKSFQDILEPFGHPEFGVAEWDGHLHFSCQVLSENTRILVDSFL